MSFQIAIDGPAGAGKSTIAKAVASKLEFIYVDTGAMYRAMGLYLDEMCKDPYDEQEASAICGKADITIAYEEGTQVVYLNGKNVNTEIRTEKAGMLASKTSAFQAVRVKLVEMQKQMAAVNNVVMDGRDIGTAVLPQAPLKIYLTASVETRAMRRYLQLQEKGMEGDLKEIEKDIAKRDHQDMTRAISPLKQAEDAYLVDSSDMTIQEVIDRILSLYEEKIGE